MPFTSQQSKGVNFQGNSLVILAGAGTGKTTILRGYAKKNIQTPMLYLCYNKSIQVEAEQKFGKKSNVTCRTLHGIAFARCGKDISHKLTGNLRLADIKKLINTNDWDFASDAGKVFNNYLSSADEHINPSHASFANSVTKSQKERVRKLVMAAKKIWNEATNPQSSFPATHDVYLKQYCLLPAEMHKWFGVILFDEAQDANPVVSDFVYRQNCSKIVVGDTHQQLYRFRGAENSIAKFIKKEQAEVLIVNTSFRFGPNVASVATNLLDFKSNKTGSEPFPLFGNEKINDSVFTHLPPDISNQRYTILHRTVSGTIKTAFDLINKKIHWVGGISKYNLDDILDVYYLKSNQKEKIKRRKLLVEYKSYSDYEIVAKSIGDYEMLRTVSIIEEHGKSLPSKFRTLKENAAHDEADADIVISTAHRSKGLEWDTVVIEDDFRDLLDPKLKLSVDDIADELNLLYVASTRAMKHLKINNLILGICIQINKNNFPNYIKRVQNKKGGPIRTPPKRIKNPQVIKLSN